MPWSILSDLFPNLSFLDFFSDSIKNINRAIKLMEEALKQKILKGHCSQRIFGPDAQTLFTWSSFWDSFSKWEKGIYERPKNEFLISEAWFAKWTKVIDFGGPKEVYRNL